ncbi:uncharacterized protein PHALS_03808 [Plasmopara halstedii]|uniref:Uncharacterized protein n=1 Tax=Plasmopara halstedii TaxID=4781 RepID=A0A0P1B0H9_PLAHL|nr:uncharacterized protein PHALS_03808 [Plasmopara halstedii]CEG47158.1 hypothetical protein PHALS_03808 [Plasmopara halstedii]|eukprot:XP_024583527.1 hypothetical protein PHALS_03808 [Plasmopara halstedii]
MRISSKGGAEYILTFVNDSSKNVAISIIKSKSEMACKFKEFLTPYESQWDNGWNMSTELHLYTSVPFQKPSAERSGGAYEQVYRGEGPRNVALQERLDGMVDGSGKHIGLFNQPLEQYDPSRITLYELALRMKPLMNHLRVIVTRSVKSDEREVGGIYDTQEVKPERIIQVMKDGDEGKVQHQVDRQPGSDDPMEAVEEPVADVEMDDIDHAPSINVQRLMPFESPVQTDLSSWSIINRFECNTKIVR